MKPLPKWFHTGIGEAGSEKKSHSDFVGYVVFVLLILGGRRFVASAPFLSLATNSQPPPSPPPHTHSPFQNRQLIVQSPIPIIFVSYCIRIVLSVSFCGGRNLKLTFGLTREPREGRPLLTVETEANRGPKEYI